MTKAKNILVVYGGVSPEHEVAIITALQVMHALKEADFEVMPLYISKEGEWYLGDDRFLKPESYKDLTVLGRTGKRVILSSDRSFGLLAKNFLGFGGLEKQPEVVFPVVHGRGGEDGTLQGLFEMTGLPYVGCGVTASAIKIDKYIAKQIAASLGIRVLKDVLVVKGESSFDEATTNLRFPVMVKPVGLGSSIGLSRVAKKSQLANALEVAFCYDTRVIVEEALDEPREINISILGNSPYRLSVTEQPIASGSVLSFEDKYIGGNSKVKGMAGAKRLIPAPIGAKAIKEVEDNAQKFFRAIGGKGMARIDFMMNKNGEIFFNEINTMPGSLAFYLWEKTCLPAGRVVLTFPKLVAKLVELAVADFNAKQGLITTFESNILSSFASNSLKGAKR